MGPLEFGDLPEQALPLIDSAPIIYFLEGHPKFGPRFRPLFEAHAAGRLRFAVTTITIAEVLTGPLHASDDALARRYRSILEHGSRSGLTSTSPKMLRDCGLRSASSWQMRFRLQVRWQSTPPQL